MEKEPRQRPEIEIKVMPDKETLEEFLKGFHGDVKVSFNTEIGEFEWLVERK